jgi:predicted RNA binding protein YcfA (HicA-like mRNA interferase family)
LPKQRRLTAQEASQLLEEAGFVLVRTKGSHQIYMKDNVRVVIPFHAGKILHPKIVKQVIKAIETA